MNSKLTIVGFGVIGVESLYALVKKINKNKKIKISIVEKNLYNIPGGIAYSKKNSKFGFFNNPLRLSHQSFIRWIKNKKNILRLVDFIRKNPSYNLDHWLKENYDNLLIKKKFDEIYFPRLTYSFYLEDKIKKIIKISKNKKIQLSFFKGVVDKLEFGKKFIKLIPTPAFQTFQIKEDYNSIKISKKKRKYNSLQADKILIGNGLLPPKKIKINNKFSDNNYIWDFYSEGGTQNLLKKIREVLRKKKNVIITFIGNKAGLLETTLQLKKQIISEKLDIKINVIAKKFSTVNKANFSKNYKKFKLKNFTFSKIKKIRKAEEILILLKKEFKYAISMGFNKYDVWTTILKNKILNRSIANLDSLEKSKYNNAIFPKIRNLTRFTFPQTILAKNFLDKNKKIKIIKGKGISIKKNKDILYVKTDTKKMVKSNIVVNVSGPVDLISLNKESKFVNTIKRTQGKFNQRGFLTDENFALSNRIFIPGVMAYNFNPSRQTIIKAITNNSRKVINFLLNSGFH